MLFIIIFECMQELLRQRLPEVISLLKRNKVKRAFAFGSIVTGPFNDKSDIDLLITFDERLEPFEYADNYWSLIDQLQKLFNREIDLITEKTLRNPYLINRINASKVLLYE